MAPYKAKEKGLLHGEQPEGKHGEETSPLTTIPPVSSTPNWREIETAPKTRSIFVSSDPETDLTGGTLAYWRVSRAKQNGVTRWHTVEYWAAVLTKRALDFTPTHWRESVVGAALEHILQMERQQAEAAIAHREAMDANHGEAA